MQVLVNIDEEDYKKVLDINNRECEWNNMHSCYKAVLDGIPLPKGHGRLIDADEIIKIITDVDGYERFENSNLFAKHYYDVVKDAPTIIEADRG